MGDREDLQDILEDALGTDKVYFQPPENVKLTYPCIIYKRDSVDSVYADNRLYIHPTRYQVTVIDRDPDSPIPGKISELPLCSFARFFTSDNLNHDVYELYY